MPRTGSSSSKSRTVPPPRRSGILNALAGLRIRSTPVASASVGPKQGQATNAGPSGVPTSNYALGDNTRTYIQGMVPPVATRQNGARHHSTRQHSIRTFSPPAPTKVTHYPTANSTTRVSNTTYTPQIPSNNAPLFTGYYNAHGHRYMAGNNSRVVPNNYSAQPTVSHSPPSRPSTVSVISEEQSDDETIIVDDEDTPNPDSDEEDMSKAAASKSRTASKSRQSLANRLFLSLGSYKHYQGRGGAGDSKEEARREKVKKMMRKQGWIN